MVTFDLTWGRYWLKKYQRAQKLRESSLVSQLIEHQQTLGSTSILGKAILVDGFYSYKLIKKVVEEDLDYKLTTPNNLSEYNQKVDKHLFFRRKILIVLENRTDV